MKHDTIMHFSQAGQQSSQLENTPLMPFVDSK